MSDKSLWLKNNKLIAEGGVLTGCDNCPCPYYAVLTIVTHSWYPGNDDNNLDNQCYQSLYTAPFAVFNNKINYSGVCIPINRKSQDRLVGSKKGCSDSYEMCVESDPENGECTKTETAYVNCGDYKVYRLSGCYDSLEAFAEYFYGKCGVEPDENDEYPIVFDVWEGAFNPSGPAMSCAMGYWREFADQLLVPKFDLVYRSYRPGVQIWPNSSECIEPAESSYQVCAEDAPDGSCARYETITEEYCAKYRPAQMFHYNGEFTYFPLMDAYWESETELPCCEYNANFLANIPKINQKIADIKSARNYPFTESVTTFPREWGFLCWGTEYESYASRERMWSGEQGYWQTLWGYGVMTFRKNDNTPDDATGVKILLKKKHITYFYYKDTDGQSHRTEEVTDETQEVSINFDEPYELPEADNLPDITDWGQDPCASRYNDPNANPCDFGGNDFGLRPDLNFTGDSQGAFERYEFKFAAMSLLFI